MSLDEYQKRILHKLDYYNYQHGFIVRHLKQGTGWDAHLERCRNFILKSLEIHKPEKITVLGSGWLLELPLAEMVEKVNEIYLVDIAHPPEVIHQVSKISAVKLLTEDVSGGLIEEIWKKTSKLPFFRKLESLKEITIPEYNPDFDPGMVISLNILSQLEVLPLRYLTKKSKVKEDELNAFRKEIQDNHINFLKRYKSVLITDLVEIFTDRSGNKSEKVSIIAELPAGLYRDNWTWDFDLKGSDFHGKRSVMQVAAIII
jgi:hypothetical protein